MPARPSCCHSAATSTTASAAALLLSSVSIAAGLFSVAALPSALPPFMSGSFSRWTGDRRPPEPEAEARARSAAAC